MISSGNRHTTSETLFEEYLTGQNLTFEYEKPYPGKAKRVDYTVPVDKRDFLFEVKEIEKPAKPRSRDIYAETRQKISEARKKFKEYRGYPCCLVLYDCDPLRPMLEIPEVMLGSMYGDVWITGAHLDRRHARAFGDPRREFRSGGKMSRPPRIRPTNTRISALITLRYVNGAWKDFAARLTDLLNNPQKQSETLEFKFEPADLHLGRSGVGECPCRDPTPSWGLLRAL
jgi:hypothetical protein